MVSLAHQLAIEIGVSILQKGVHNGRLEGGADPRVDNTALGY